MSHKNPEHRRVGSRLSELIRWGKFPRADTKICIDCGQPAKEYDHARGYDINNPTDADPVCYLCHARRAWDRGEQKVTPERMKGAFEANKARGNRKTVNCQFCGRPFETRGYYDGVSKGKYCSASCRGRASARSRALIKGAVA